MRVPSCTYTPVTPLQNSSTALPPTPYLSIYHSPPPCVSGKLMFYWGSTDGASGAGSVRNFLSYPFFFLQAVQLQRLIFDADKESIKNYYWKWNTKGRTIHVAQKSKKRVTFLSIWNRTRERRRDSNSENWVVDIRSPLAKRDFTSDMHKKTGPLL